MGDFVRQSLAANFSVNLNLTGPLRCLWLFQPMEELMGALWQRRIGKMMLNAILSIGTDRTNAVPCHTGVRLRRARCWRKEGYAHD
jgi:hypothetical protein